MKEVLAFLAVMALLAAVAVFSNAKSAVHEIEAFILGLIFVNAMAGAGIIEAITRVRALEPPSS